MGRIRLALTAVAAALAIAACNAGTRLPVERNWALTLPAAQDAAVLPVTVVDETGTVKLAEVGAGALPPMEGFGGASSVDGNRNRILVGWVGGRCDLRAEVRYRTAGDGWEAVVTTETAPDACDAAGVGRSVILDLSDGLQVDPVRVAVTSGG